MIRLLTSVRYGQFYSRKTGKIDPRSTRSGGRSGRVTCFLQDGQVTNSKAAGRAIFLSFVCSPSMANCLWHWWQEMLTKLFAARAESISAFDIRQIQSQCGQCLITMSLLPFSISPASNIDQDHYAIHLLHNFLCYHAVTRLGDRLHSNRLNHPNHRLYFKLAC